MKKTDLSKYFEPINTSYAEVKQAFKDGHTDRDVNDFYIHELFSHYVAKKDYKDSVIVMNINNVTELDREALIKFDTWKEFKPNLFKNFNFNTGNILIIDALKRLNREAI